MKSYADVDAYLADARAWRAEMVALRAVMLRAGLDEAIKWGKPCYGAAGGNIAIMQPFKACLGLMFFKGALLSDPDGVLRDQGENSRSAKRIEIRSVADVEALAPVIGAYLAQAVALERAGAKVAPRAPRALVVPDELGDAFDADPDLRAGWEALTPGRQRGYVLHIGGAKKAETRAARVAKCAPAILAGKGLTDR